MCNKNSVYKNRILFLVPMLIMGLFLLCGCGASKDEDSVRMCKVVLEDGEGFEVENPAQVVKVGENLQYTIHMKEGYSVEGTDYGLIDSDYSISYGTTPDVIYLNLNEVKYSTVVTVNTSYCNYEIGYLSNGGKIVENAVSKYKIKDNEEGRVVQIPTKLSHLRVNTSIGTEIFERDGYTLIGWNTKSDGSGVSIGLGSRVEPNEGLVLYAQWSKWTDSDKFQYEANGENVTITGYTGDEKILTIPELIDGKSVIFIAKGAFAGCTADTVILPKTIQKIDSNAFTGASLKTLYMFDNIRSVSDYSFEDCKQLSTLHLNAVEAPVYSGNYFDTFNDKYDRLVSLKDKKKIVLFSGSSTRFGYNSKKIDEAFGDYEVVNMGVFAYTNALPQLLLILNNMNEGDILLDSPEFDAAKRQFCTTKDLDESFFCMMESNYDTVTELDLQMVQKVFSSLNTYLDIKEGMTPKRYDISASDYDEDGNRLQEKSYNEYGDYIVFRENSLSEEPIYGLGVEYTVTAFPKDYYIDTVNEMYQKFLDKGVKVFFTYSPRNRLAISENSTPDERAKLDAYLREQLIIPVISYIEDSLVSGIYLYGTDNHLSTEGVEIRTDKIIEELKNALEEY